jgi:hypothetical protein
MCVFLRENDLTVSITSWNRSIQNERRRLAIELLVGAIPAYALLRLRLAPAPLAREQAAAWETAQLATR